MSVQWDFLTGNFYQGGGGQPLFINGQYIPPGAFAEFFPGLPTKPGMYIDTSTEGSTIKFPKESTTTSVNIMNPTGVSSTMPQAGASAAGSAGVGGASQLTPVEPTWHFSPRDSLRGAGAGFSVGGPIGAIIGAIAGGYGDSAVAKMQTAGSAETAQSIIDSRGSTGAAPLDSMFNYRINPLTGVRESSNVDNANFIPTSIPTNTQTPTPAFTPTYMGPTNTQSPQSSSTLVPSIGGTSGSNTTGRVIAPNTKKPDQTTGALFGPDVRKRTGRRSTVYAGGNYRRGDVYIPTLIGS